MITRRSLLVSTALFSGAALAGCSTAQIANVQATWAAVAGQIQSAVAVASTYVPTVESIIATAASLFGPQYAVIVAAGTAAFNQIVATLVNVVSNLSPAASVRLGVRLRASSPQVPVTIGKTPAGIVIHGWRS